ncbi:MAG: plastocyanin/azurin family copper-binding protein [Gemmatimonadales bacterium]
MRVTSVVGLAIVLAACGGEKKAEDQQTTATPEQPAPPAEGGAAAGATHDVNMVLEGSSYKYVPDQISIKGGDVIRFHNVSGGPHNVAFWGDSIPKGAESAISVPDPLSPLSSKLAVAPDEVIEVKFTKAPAGEYKFFCTPHLAMGMKGKVTVQ